MRRPANGLVVLFTAALVTGCTPGTSTPPPAEPATADVIPQPETKRIGVPAIKKKMKEPGPRNATREVSLKPNAAL
jgi:hypothetical protein